MLRDRGREGLGLEQEVCWGNDIVLLGLILVGR